MADPTEDIEVKVADEAAEAFVESYYPALNNTANARKRLTEFYIKPNTVAPNGADITLNGNIIATPEELQAMFENQVTQCLYEAQSFDCQVLNKNYNVGVDESNLGPNKDGKKMSIMVMVCGSVKYYKDGVEGETRGFTETFMLVPNMEAQRPNAARGLRRWLIQSQEFRLVV